MESAPEDLVLSVVSTNQGLLPNEAITVSMGTYPTQRVVHVVPAKDMNGMTLLTFTVSDGTNSASVSTTLRVTAVNDAPNFELDNNYANINAVVNQAYSQKVIAVASRGPADEVKQLLIYVIANNNPGIFLIQPRISADGILTFKAKAKGTAVLTVGLKDSGGTLNGGANQSGTATINITIQ